MTTPPAVPSAPIEKEGALRCDCICHDLGDDRVTCAARGCCAAWRKGAAEVTSLRAALQREIESNTNARQQLGQARAEADRLRGEVQAEREARERLKERIAAEQRLSDSETRRADAALLRAQEAEREMERQAAIARAEIERQRLLLLKNNEDWSALRAEFASATQRLEAVRGALARLLDTVATVDTDQPEADFACIACHGLDGHHRPGCAVQAGFRALAGETGTGRGTT